MLKGLGILFVLYWASDVLGFKALNWILNLVVNSGAVVLVVLFQKELRSALEQIGRASSTRLDRIRQGDPRVRIDMREKCISELTTAITNLSRRRVGALVVIEQQTGLKDVIESGTHIDAEISAPLIENIFEPNTPLHDGAVIIRGYRVEAAACILTLSENTSISRELGTRAPRGAGHLGDDRQHHAHRLGGNGNHFHGTRRAADSSSGWEVPAPDAGEHLPGKRRRQPAVAAADQDQAPLQTGGGEDLRRHYAA